MYSSYFYYDSTYLLVLLGALLSIIASATVNATYAKYNKVMSTSMITGAMAAERILRYAGIGDVSIEEISGQLSDHYDPRHKVLRLSSGVFNSTSIAAIGVAAHECGHAIQDNKGYVPLKLRGALVPVANLGSKLGLPIVLIGLLLAHSYTLTMLGVWVFSIAVLFQIVTLPVEFNASGRAIRMLGDTGILGDHELKGASSVLKAAALTYVAAAAASILQLLRLILLFGGGNRRRD
ncbi:MAG: zinc metallopeptidase [Clostridia bacterium]|nr:zinc metallopeptidase [Clostridia bacterium]